MTHHALIAILFCTGVAAFLAIVLADSRVPKVPRARDTNSLEAAGISTR
jgi:hypothetical protein